MRLGLVSPYDLSIPGGVQSQVLGLADRLARHDVEVIGPGLPDGLPGLDLGASLRLPANRSRVPIAVDPRAILRIGEYVAGFDLLHVHEPLMPLASLAALRAGPPVVATFHADPGPLGRAVYLAAGRGLASLLGPNTRRVTAVSATAAAPLRGLTPTIIPVAVDTGAMRVSVDRHPRRVAFLGRDEPRKGLEVLLRAWPEVAHAFPEAELVVMGAEPRSGPGVWMGRVDDVEKAEVLSSSAIFVAPNLGGESFGIVLIEGMAAGAAVVASDLPAFRDAGGEAAHYFPVGDSSALAGELIDLLGDQGRRDDLAEKGRARAPLFDWDRVVRAYAEEYRRAVDGAEAMGDR